MKDTILLGTERSSVEAKRMQAGYRNIVFDILMQLVGVPPNPGLAAKRPVERTCRCGFMLRMTSRERVTQQCARSASIFDGARDGDSSCMRLID